ncbi:hypothetical protein WA026_017913, partial [Henosepilachna vigintioctopunctata]
VIVLFAAVASVTSTEIIQGPSVRTFNAGPDGHFIDSIATGGAVINGPTPFLVPPTLKAVAGVADGSWVQETLPNYVFPGLSARRVYGGPFIYPVPGAPVFAKSFYEAAFYPGRVFPVPYGKAVISGPSGTIVADHH